MTQEDPIVSYKNGDFSIRKEHPSNVFLVDVEGVKIIKKEGEEEYSVTLKIKTGYYTELMSRKIPVPSGKSAVEFAKTICLQAYKTTSGLLDRTVKLYEEHTGKKVVFPKNPKVYHGGGAGFL